MSTSLIYMFRSSEKEEIRVKDSLESSDMGNHPTSGIVPIKQNKEIENLPPCFDTRRINLLIRSFKVVQKIQAKASKMGQSLMTQYKSIKWRKVVNKILVQICLVIQLLSGFKDVAKNFDRIPTQAPQMAFVFNEKQKAIVEQQEQQDPPKVVLSFRKRLYCAVTNPKDVENAIVGGVFFYKSLQRITKAELTSEDKILVVAEGLWSGYLLSRWYIPQDSPFKLSQRTVNTTSKVLFLAGGVYDAKASDRMSQTIRKRLEDYDMQAKRIYSDRARDVVEIGLYQERKSKRAIISQFNQAKVEHHRYTIKFQRKLTEAYDVLHGAQEILRTKNGVIDQKDQNIEGLEAWLLHLAGRPPLANP